jgi:hypothetical protein
LGVYVAEGDDEIGNPQLSQFRLVVTRLGVGLDEPLRQRERADLVDVRRVETVDREAEAGRRPPGRSGRCDCGLCFPAAAPAACELGSELDRDRRGVTCAGVTAVKTTSVRSACSKSSCEKML